MLIRLAMRLCEVSPLFKRFLWRQWYQYLAGYQRADWTFMNYGFTSLTSDGPALELQPDDEPNRYSIQLYHHVASAVPLAGLDVLEVGSGRGGGASFVKRYHRPEQLTGVDLSPKAVRFCRDQYRLEGLSFVPGDAESLPLDDKSFDAVLNVESSHCYGSMPKFLEQVRRVLRPGGHFLFADLRSAADRDRLHRDIEECGMILLEQEDISANVLAALRCESARKLALIEHAVRQPMQNAFRQFAAVEGSEVYDGFKMGATVYLRYLLQRAK
ncbi:MAG TPA: class I SAM-dependent methyltransferase [Pirellulaceae bacterium]|nr:class I SAM-dependent methyltransferase [Pirellulaceae bacterium]